MVALFTVSGALVLTGIFWDYWHRELPQRKRAAIEAVHYYP